MEKIRPLFFCALLAGTIRAADEKEHKKAVLVLEADEVNTSLGITVANAETSEPEVETENTLETFTHKFQSGFTLLTIQVRNHWDAKTAAIGGFALSTVLFCALYLNSQRNARALQERDALKVQLTIVQNEVTALQNEKNVLTGLFNTERNAHEKLTTELAKAREDVVLVKRLLEEEKTRSNVQRAKVQNLEEQNAKFIEQSVKAEDEKRKNFEQCMKNINEIADELSAVAIPLGPAPVNETGGTFILNDEGESVEVDTIIYTDEGAANKVAELVSRLRDLAQRLQQPSQPPARWSTRMWSGVKNIFSSAQPARD